MNSQKSTLTFRDYPYFNWVTGLFLLILGLSYWPFMVRGTNFVNSIFSIIEIIGGFFLLIVGSVMTVVADKNNQKLIVSNRSVIKSARQEVAFSEIDAIQFETNSIRQSSGRNHGPTYRIVVICKDGKTVPFHSYYSSGTESKMKQVEKLRAFIGVGNALPT